MQAVEPRKLDHVAFWVSDRGAIVERCVRWFGMHVIDSTDDFTLVGTDARQGKLTLFDAPGPREPRAFHSLGLRVSDLDSTPLPSGQPLDLGEGLVVRLVEAPTATEFDLDHVVLRASDPRAVAAEYERYGFERVGETRVEVAGAHIDFVPGDSASGERPLLNHLAVLVDSADEHRL